MASLAPQPESEPARALRSRHRRDDGCVDGIKVARVRRAMKSDLLVAKLARTFRVMGDPTRTKVIYALCLEELCVSDLARLLGTSPSVISHQLRALKDLDLVRRRRAGRITYYALDDHHIRNLFDECVRHVEELIPPGAGKANGGRRRRT